MPISYAGEPAGLSLQDELPSLRTVWGAVEMLRLLQKQKEKEGVVSVCLTAYVSCFCTYRTNMNRVCTKIPKVLAAKFLGFFPGLQNNQKLNCSRAVFMVCIRLNPVHFWKGLQSLYKYSHNSDQPCSYFRHLPSTFIGMVLNDPWPKAE